MIPFGPAPYLAMLTVPVVLCQTCAAVEVEISAREGELGERAIAYRR